MVSQWYELKETAISLRKQGTSIGEINRIYNIPKSTLSGWFRGISLTKEQKKIIHDNASIKMEAARKKAVLWHNNQKRIHIENAYQDSRKTMSKIKTWNNETIELALSFLYLGEGAKTGSTSIGNSNPMILLFFVNAIEKLYKIKRNNFKCNLHIRSDQNGKALNRYWSNSLGIPIENFGKILVDKRTAKSKTFSNYKGVCVVRVGNIHIKRKLLFLSSQFCDKISDTRTISSVGRALS